MKKLNMFVLDWLVIPVWCAIFPLGDAVCAIIMAFVTAVFCFLNYRDSRRTVTLFLEDINLMGATVLGIMLNNLLFIRFIYADRERVSAMVVIIFVALVYVTFLMIISMTVKEIGRRKRRRIINSLADSDPADPDEDRYRRRYDFADDDDDDFEDEREDRFETERRVLERMNRMSDNVMDRVEDEEEPETEDETKGPKFKVIKKGHK